MMPLSVERIAELRAKREALILNLEELKRSKQVLRYGGSSGEKGGHPSSWRQAVQSTENLIASIGKLLRPYELIEAKKVRKRSEVPRTDVFDLLASLPNTPNSDVRISIRKRGAARLLDVRVWRRLPDGEAVPTLKGVTLNADELERLSEAIALARSRLGATDQGGA